VRLPVSREAALRNHHSKATMHSPLDELAFFQECRKCGHVSSVDQDDLACGVIGKVGGRGETSKERGQAWETTLS